MTTPNTMGQDLSSACRRNVHVHNATVTAASGVTDGYTFTCSIAMRVRLGAIVTSVFGTAAATLQLGTASSAGAYSSLVLALDAAAGNAYYSADGWVEVPAGTVLVFDQASRSGNGVYLPFIEYEVLEAGESA